MTSETTILAGRVDQPRVQLLDADVLNLDADELRERARALGASAAFVSRSYRYPYALIATHTVPVGVDVERIEALPPRFAASICTPAELHRADDCLDSDRHVTSIWSGKEALAKALGDPLRYDPRRLEGPADWPSGQSGPWRGTALTAPAGYVGWLCWRSR